MRVFTSLLALSALVLGNTAAAADKPAFDARLSGYDYPYAVHTLSLDSQRQDLEMAYMDVRPKNAKGDTVLLLHGKNFSGAYWQTTIERLTEEAIAWWCRIKSASANPASPSTSSIPSRPWRTTRARCSIS